MTEPARIELLPESGAKDFGDFAAALANAGHRGLRPQPRGIVGSTGLMMGVTVDPLGADFAHVIDRLGRGLAVILHQNSVRSDRPAPGTN